MTVQHSIIKPFALPTFDPHWKDKCLQCLHVIQTDNGHGGTILRCRVGGKISRTIHKHCIDIYDTSCITKNLFAPANT